MIKMKRLSNKTRLQLKLETIALLRVRGGYPGDPGVIVDTMGAGCGSNGCDTWTVSGNCPSAVCV